MAALCIAGERECATGSATTAGSLVVVPAGMGAGFAQQTPDRVGEERGELVVGEPVLFEVAAVGVVHLRVVPHPAGVGAEQVRLRVAPERLRAVHVVRAHPED